MEGKLDGSQVWQFQVLHFHLEKEEKLMIQGDLTFEVTRVPVFCGSIRSHREQDPPVRLQRLGGTVNQLIMAHQGFFIVFLAGEKILFVFLPFHPVGTGWASGCEVWYSRWLAGGIG